MSLKTAFPSLWLTALIVLLSLSAVGCQGEATGRAAAGADGSAATGGVDGAPADGAASACPELPVGRHSAGVTLALVVDPVLHDQPLLFGEENAFPGGGTVLPTNLRFYVSDVALLRASGPAVPVDLVTPAGALIPYGVHLFDAEETATRTLRVLAPPDDYTGVTFLLGLDPLCNSGSAFTRKPPLSPTSQLTWPHLAGYLFLRYEGRNSGVAAETAPPPAIHMGGTPGVPSAPLIRIETPLPLSAGSSPSKTVRLAMDQVFKGASTDVDLAGFFGPPGEEVIAGERLRRNASTLQLFSFAP